MEVGCESKTQFMYMRLLSLCTMTRNTLHTLVFLSVCALHCIEEADTPSTRHPVAVAADSASVPRLPRLISTH